MKKLIFYFLLPFISLFTSSLKSQSLLKFKISRPYCLMNFIETAYGGHGSSQTLRDSITAHTKGDKAFADLVEQYRSIPLDFSWKRAEYPENRRPNRSTYDLVSAAAVQANDIDDFMNRIAGIIPNSDLSKLSNILKKVEPYYERIMWQPYGTQILSQIDSLQRYQTKANEAFKKLKKFYNTSWSDDLPFTVAIYPIAAQRRKPTHTTATVHANNLCVSVLTQERRYAERMGVILHEISHALYDEQSVAFQHELEGYFSKNKSPYTEGARNFLNEAVATACGQGWVHNFLAGKPDPSSWYHDEYIDGFARALYPMVADYINNDKPMDVFFINEAVRLFGVTFPKAAYDAKMRMNRLHLYMNSEDKVTVNKLQGHLFEFFNISSMSTSSPISAPESIEDIKKTPSETLVFMIDKDFEKTFKTLKTVLPDFKNQKYNLKEDFVLAFLDTNNRLVVIIKSPLDKMKKGIELLEKQRFIENGKVYLAIK